MPSRFARRSSHRSRRYRYYTRLNSHALTSNLRDRDVVRWKLSVKPAAAGK